MIKRVSVLAVLALWILISGVKAIRSFESVPASDGGVLTAKAGQQISLTCTHDNTGGVTVWKFGDPIDCTRGFLHLGAGSQQECGPFSFINISQTNMAPFTSTIVANATSSMTGVVVQCLDGSGGSIVGNATLCIVDNPPSPTNLQCQPMSGRMVEISWSPVPQDCTMSSVYYRINITGNITEEILINTTDTSGQFSLNATQDYVATVTAVMIEPTMRVSEGVSCPFTAEEVVVTTLSTTTVPPTTLPPTDATETPTPEPAPVLPVGAIVGGVVGGICVIIIVVVLVVVCVKYYHVIFSCCHGEGKDDPDTHELRSPTDRTSVEHEQAPGGEEYAVVTTTKKTVAVDSFYQDPSTIQHEQSAGGDLYAVADKPKKGSKKEKSEEVLADMYSVPDKSKKNQLTYADIDMSGGSGRPVHPVPQMEYATVVN